jgi:predicted acyltransferase
MTFVNYLAGIAHIPGWAKHMPDKADGYTFVDLVFPAFLFIVGVSIPLAFHKRLSRGDSLVHLIGRVIGRSASLILVGVIMVNSGSYSAGATGMSKALWYLLAMLMVVVLWNVYPAEAPKAKKRLFLILRCAGALVLAGLLAAFRGKTHDGDVVWLQHSWWGILGLIGWAYLVASVGYLVFRGSSLAMMGFLGFLIAVFIGDRHGVLDWLGPVQSLVGVGPVLGSTASDVVMGVLVGNLFVGPGAAMTQPARARFMLVFGVGLYLAGMLMRPLHGINKNAATDSYALVSGGISCLCFLIVYCLMDWMKLRRWAAPFSVVGQNALLAYILPGMLGNFLALIGLPGILWHFDSGGAGALNAAAVTLLVVAITWGATRLGVRLRL